MTGFLIGLEVRSTSVQPPLGGSFGNVGRVDLLIRQSDELVELVLQFGAERLLAHSGTCPVLSPFGR